MTAKEALETINRLGISARGYMNLKEAINIAIISLDKQIPKKPINGCCPDCGISLKSLLLTHTVQNAEESWMLLGVKNGEEEKT